MIRAGMDVARVNFSHVRTFEEAKARVDALGKAMELAGRRILILADLQGPKIRIGALGTPIVVATGSTVTLSPANDDAAPQVATVPLHPPEILKDLKVGDRVFVDDGKICMRVSDIQDGRVAAEVLAGGEIKSRKGLNFPDSKLSEREQKYLTELDGRLRAILGDLGLLKQVK